MKNINSFLVSVLFTCSASAVPWQPSDVQCKNFAKKAAISLMELNFEMRGKATELSLVSADDDKWEWIYEAVRYDIYEDGEKYPLTAPHTLGIGYRPFAPGAGNCVLNKFERHGHIPHFDKPRP